MAGTEPTITDAVLRWPCCVHCVGEAIGSRGASSCPVGDEHLEPCVELVELQDLDWSRLVQCQGPTR